MKPWIWIAIILLIGVTAAVIGNKVAKKDCGCSGSVSDTSANPTQKQWVVNGQKLCADPSVRGQFLPCDQLKK